MPHDMTNNMTNNMTDNVTNHVQKKRARRAKKLDTAQMMMLARIESAGCPIDERHVQRLYLASAYQDPECRVPLPIAIGGATPGGWKPRDIKQVIRDCPHANELRAWLAYLFVVVHRQLELCWLIQEKINVPPPEGLKLEKLLLGLIREMRKLGCPVPAADTVGECRV